MAAIGDEDSITGLLLAGIGHIDSHQKKNFLVVDASKIQTHSFLPAARAVANAPPRNPQKKNDKLKRDMMLLSIETPLSTVEEAFQEFTKRKDIAIILINQHVRGTKIDSHGTCPS